MRTKASDMPESSETNIFLRLWNYSQVPNSTQSIPASAPFGGNLINVTFFSKLEDAFNLDFKLADKLEPNKNFRIADNLYVSLAYSFEWLDANSSADYGEKGFCKGLRDQIVILADGTVIPCCLDSEGTINLGNVSNQTISNIINDQQYNKWRTCCKNVQQFLK
jgi:hypothetical protein